MKKAEPTQLEPTKTPPPPVKRSQKAILHKTFNEFITRTAQAEPVRQILASLNLHWPTLQRALETHPEWRVRYNRARKDAIEMYVAEIVPMSDAVIGEEMNVVTATRNAVDARKWVAGKLAPREYGDAPGGVTINQQTNVMVVSEDRLKQLQALRQQMLSSPSTPPP